MAHAGELVETVLLSPIVALVVAPQVLDELEGREGDYPRLDLSLSTSAW